MEIQAQAPVNTTATTNISAGTGGKNGAITAGSASNPSAPGFTATLNGMLVGTPEGNATPAPLSLAGLNALVQLMTALKADASQQTQDQGIDNTLKQLDSLIDLLDTDSETATDLLQSPDVQAWLAEIQALLLQQPSTTVPSTETQTDLLNESGAPETVQPADNKTIQTNAASLNLNPALFVPLDTPVNSGNLLNEIPAQTIKPLTKSEVKTLLENFKQKLAETGNAPTEIVTGKALQKITTDLQQLLAPYLLSQKPNETSVVTASMETDNLTPLLPVRTVSGSESTKIQAKGSATTQVKAVDTAGGTSFQVQINTTPTHPKLEYLAAKSVQLQPSLQTDAQTTDAPLFEPLAEMPADLISDNTVMPMHEFLKHMQSGDQLSKAPTLLMHAPAFVEDMTQFIVKSFTLDVRAEGIAEAKLSLYPQHLGQVDVKLTMHNGQLAAQFMAESSAGREMLESQLPQLRTMLQSQGIQVDKLEVTQSQSFQSGMFQEQRQQQSQQSNKQSKGNGTDKIPSIEDELIQQSTQVGSVSNSLNRTSFDTTA